MFRPFLVISVFKGPLYIVAKKLSGVLKHKKAVGCVFWKKIIYVYGLDKLNLGMKKAAVYHELMLNIWIYVCMYVYVGV